jgi:hypothetical protein
MLMMKMKYLLIQGLPTHPLVWPYAREKPLAPLSPMGQEEAVFLAATYATSWRMRSCLKRLTQPRRS